MTKVKKNLLLVLLIAVLVTSVFAVPATVSLKLGVSQAQTDIYKDKQLNGMIGLSYEAWLMEYLSLGISPYYTKVGAGDDDGIHFKSPVVGADVMFKFRPHWDKANLVMEDKPITRIAPYVTAGGGLSNFFPTDKDGHHYTGWPDDDYSYTAGVFPALGLGLTFFTKYGVDFDLGFQKNYLMSDYLESWGKGDTDDSYWMGFVGISHTFGDGRKAEKPKYQFSRKKPLILSNVTFNSGSADLTNEAKYILDDVAASLNYYAKVNVEIQGHTDNTGSPELNNPLSQARALAVKTYLVNKGVSDARLTTSGWGSNRPVDTNETAEGRANNRRIEFKVTN